MISSICWLKGAEGDKVVISGMNMPLTVLSLQSTQKNGIKTYEIALDAQLTEQIADNSDVLASSSDANASVLVTEE